MPIYKMKGKKEGKQRYRVRVNFTDNEGKARQIDRVAYGLEDAKTLERELAQSKTEQLITRLPTINQLFNEFVCCVVVNIMLGGYLHRVLKVAEPY